MASNADSVPGRAEGLPYRAQSAGSRAGGQATSAQELPGRAVCAVRRAAAGCPALRRAWAALSRDLLALLTRLRPAIMLDYVTHVPEQELCSLVQEVASLVPRAPGTEGVELFVAELDGCCYILRPDLVLERARDSSAVRWIAFAEEGHSTRCHWATDVQSEIVHGRLVAVAEQLRQFCASGCEDRVFRLGSCSGAPIMPSLSGWLLGYPVAYLVDAANVGAAASWLSSADLALHSVIIACPLLQEAVGKAGSLSASSRADLDVLCSFTVPAELLSNGDSDVKLHLQNWVQGLCQGTNGGSAPNQDARSLLGTLWGPVRVEVDVSRHHVVL